MPTHTGLARFGAFKCILCRNFRNVDIVRTDAEYAYLRGEGMYGDRISITTLESPLNGMKVRTADDPVEVTDDEEQRLAAESDPK